MESSSLSEQMQIRPTYNPSLLTVWTGPSRITKNYFRVWRSWRIPTGPRGAFSWWDLSELGSSSRSGPPEVDRPPPVHCSVTTLLPNPSHHLQFSIQLQPIFSSPASRVSQSVSLHLSVCIGSGPLRLVYELGLCLKTRCFPFFTQPHWNLHGDRDLILRICWCAGKVSVVGCEQRMWGLIGLQFFAWYVSSR